jgi:hypothetical protein
MSNSSKSDNRSPDSPAFSPMPSKPLHALADAGKLSARQIAALSQISSERLEQLVDEVCCHIEMEARWILQLRSQQVSKSGATGASVDGLVAKPRFFNWEGVAAVIAPDGSAWAWGERSKAWRSIHPAELLGSDTSRELPDDELAESRGAAPIPAHLDYEAMEDRAEKTAEKLRAMWPAKPIKSIEARIAPSKVSKV